MQLLPGHGIQVITDQMLKETLEESAARVQYHPPDFPPRPQGPFTPSGPLPALQAAAFDVYTAAWSALSFEQKCRALGLMIVEDVHNRGRDEVIARAEAEWGQAGTNAKSYVVAYNYTNGDFAPASPTHFLATGQGHVQGFVVLTQLGTRYLGLSICHNDYPLTPCRWAFYRESRIKWKSVSGVQVVGGPALQCPAHSGEPD